jgi:hypothetical protein
MYINLSSFSFADFEAHPKVFQMLRVFDVSEWGMLVPPTISATDILSQKISEFFFRKN